MRKIPNEEETKSETNSEMEKYKKKNKWDGVRGGGG